MKKKITAVDLFCGAGGTSTGLAEVCRELGFDLDLVAVNHWDVAISTHSKNHPNAKHYCCPIDAVDPLEAVPGGRVNLLVASPECTHFSNARGGKPMLDQKRATPWDILRWLEKLYVENVLIENVKEFRTWGPLGANGRPLKSKRGDTYRAFIEAIKSLGYNVEDKVMNAANYGAATTRERLFIIARRGNRKVSFPAITHSAVVTNDLFDSSIEKWRSARDIIDWSIPGKSIFARKKPLANSTLKRIEAGLRKFGGINAEPFIVMLRNHGQAISINDPLMAITTSGAHHALIEPFVIGQQSCSIARSVKEPIMTVSTGGAIALVEPFIVPQFSDSNPKSVDEPIGVITTTSRGIGLCEAFITTVHHGKDDTRSHSTEKPMPAITSVDGYALVEPFMVPYMSEAEGQKGRVHSTEKPMPTVTSNIKIGLVEPILMCIDHGSGDGSPRPVSDPLHTITTKERLGIIEPYIVQFNKNSKQLSVEHPLPTQTTKDKFGLVEAEVTQYQLDIRFRMLQPHELAAAMGFPRDYNFQGNRESIVKQIGNAVEKNNAKANIRELLKAA